MLEMCTGFLQKTACENLLSFLIYKVTYRPYGRQKEKNSRHRYWYVSLQKQPKHGTSNGGNSGEVFFGHSYILCNSFVVKIGLLSKISRFFIFHVNFYWPKTWISFSANVYTVLSDPGSEYWAFSIYSQKEMYFFFLLLCKSLKQWSLLKVLLNYKNIFLAPYPSHNSYLWHTYREI